MYIFIYIDRQTDRFIIRNWLAQLQRLRSPKICTGEEQLMIQFRPQLKAKGTEGGCPGSKTVRQSERILPSSAFLFHSGPQWAEEAQPQPKGHPLHPVHQFQRQSHPEHPHRHTQTTFNQIPGQHVPQSTEFGT